MLEFNTTIEETHKSDKAVGSNLFLETSIICSGVNFKSIKKKSLNKRFFIANVIAAVFAAVVSLSCSKDNNDDTGLEDAPTAAIANGTVTGGSGNQTSGLVGYKSIKADVGGNTASASIDANGNFSLALPTPSASSLSTIDGSRNSNNKVFALETFTVSTEGIQRAAVKNVTLRNYSETSTEISLTVVYFYYIPTAVKVKETATDTRDGVKVTVELNLNLLPGWNRVISTLIIGKDGKSGSFIMRTGPIPSGVKWQ